MAETKPIPKGRLSLSTATSPVLERTVLPKLSVTAIKPDPDNPRVLLTVDDPDYKSIKNSIDKNGFVEPMIVDTKTMTLVGGHQRMNILLAEGVTELYYINFGGILWLTPSNDLPELTPKNRKLLMVALNKVGGKFDLPKLTNLFRDLSADIPMPELALGTGFSEFETKNLLATPDIDKFFAQMDETPNPAPTGLDPEGTVKAKKPVKQFVVCPNCQQEIEI